MVLAAALHEPARALQVLQRVRPGPAAGSATHRALRNLLEPPSASAAHAGLRADRDHPVVLAGPDQADAQVIAHRIAQLLQARQVPARQIVAGLQPGRRRRAAPAPARAGRQQRDRL